VHGGVIRVADDGYDLPIYYMCTNDNGLYNDPSFVFSQPVYAVVYSFCENIKWFPSSGVYYMHNDTAANIVYYTRTNNIIYYYNRRRLFVN